MTITSALKPILKQENGAVDQTLANVARTQGGVPKNDSVQVGACDIQNFYPLQNGWRNDPSQADKESEIAAGSGFCRRRLWRSAVLVFPEAARPRDILRESVPEQFRFAAAA
jgi:hypothetical protein